MKKKNREEEEEKKKKKKREEKWTKPTSHRGQALDKLIVRNLKIIKHHDHDSVTKKSHFRFYIRVCTSECRGDSLLKNCRQALGTRMRISVKLD